VLCLHSFDIAPSHSAPFRTIMARHCQLVLVIGRGKRPWILWQTYLGVEEIYRNPEQEDHHEEGEELLQTTLASTSTTKPLIDVPCTHQHVSGQVVPGVDHRENTEGSSCNYKRQYVNWKVGESSQRGSDTDRMRQCSSHQPRARVQGRGYLGRLRRQSVST
jgi:hypothetical protein